MDGHHSWKKEEMGFSPKILSWSFCLLGYLYCMWSWIVGEKQTRFVNALFGWPRRALLDSNFVRYRLFSQNMHLFESVYITTTTEIKLSMCKLWLQQSGVIPIPFSLCINSDYIYRAIALVRWRVTTQLNCSKKQESNIWFMFWLWDFFSQTALPPQKKINWLGSWFPITTKQWKNSSVCLCNDNI